MPNAPLSALQPALWGEQDQWLRRRFVLYCAILTVACAFAVALLAFGASTDEPAEGRNFRPLAIAFASIGLLIYAAPLVYVLRRRTVQRRTILRLSYAVTLAFAAAFVVPSMALAQVISAGLRETGLRNAQIGAMGPWFFGFLASHVLACLIIPWRPREAAISYLPVSLIMAALTLTIMPDPLDVRIVAVLILLVVGAPGVLICAVRHSRFARRFHLSTLADYYEETTQELTSARRIHEALLPGAIRDAGAVVEYAYEPMRAIGGDFLYLHDHRDGPTRLLSCVLVDVTGHGIPAALTVHRLHGELERIYGERPAADAGFVLAQLNRYVHVALAKHSVYATALCAQWRLSPTNPARLRYASAGHPPAFHISRTGRAATLDTTCALLGAVDPEQFDPEPVEQDFAPGDRLIAFTDGAFECRVGSGDMLRIAGLQHIVEDCAAAEDASGAILAALQRARAAIPPSDDTLILSVRIPPAPSSQAPT